MLISEKTMNKILQAEIRLGGKKDLQYFVDTLKITGSVEVGYRATCGSTDRTMKVFREWRKIVKLLNKDGNILEEIEVIHKNRYATNNGGFWNSVIFKIKNKYE